MIQRYLTAIQNRNEDIRTTKEYQTKYIPKSIAEN